MESEEGTFSSPGYPDNYPLETQCEWTIKASEGNGVQLSFEEFDLADSTNCDDDYVEIRENSKIGKLIGVFCGGNVPSNISHTGNALWLLFNSNKRLAGSSVVTGKGFLAHYNLGIYFSKICFEFPPHSPDLTTHLHVENPTNCSGI